MNGAHDIGGRDGFGSIQIEMNEPVFREEWESRVFGLLTTTFAFGAWNLDEFRHAVERMSPIDYLDTTYYEHWLHALETLVLEKGVVSPEELQHGRANSQSFGKAPPDLCAAAVPSAVLKGSSTRLDVEVKPNFSTGDRVLVKNVHPLGHTRLPLYVRGRQGTIVRDYGVFVFPDSNSSGDGQNPQHLYNVEFNHEDLFGSGSMECIRVALDLWDDYLEIKSI